MFRNSVGTGQKSRRKATKGKGKKRSKGKGKKTVVLSAFSESKDSYGICAKTYNESEEWICCDACEQWYHRHLDLDEEEFRLYSGADAVYICPISR